MSKKTQAADAARPESAALRQVPQQINPFAHVGDAHWGKGGRFVVGADGKREPVTTDTEAEHG